VEINRIPWRRMEDNSTPTQLALRVLSVLPAVGWLKRPAYLMKQFSLIEIMSTCSAASYVVVDLSRVFHAVDSSYTSSYPQVHTCSSWNANCTSNTLFRRCGSMFGFRSLDSVVDADWCYNASLTASLFARLRQLHSFKQRLLSHPEHCPNSMD